MFGMHDILLVHSFICLLSVVLDRRAKQFFYSFKVARLREVKMDSIRCSSLERLAMEIAFLSCY